MKNSKFIMYQSTYFYIILLLVPSLNANFQFFSGGSGNYSSGSSPFFPNGPKSGSGANSNPFNFGGGGLFKFDFFMEFPGLQDSNIGKFLLDAMNLFTSKGLFFTSTEEKQKSPYKMPPPDEDFETTDNKGSVTTTKKTSVSNPKTESDKIDTSINSDGDSLDTMIHIFENIISDSPHRAHPFYLKRDAAGLDAYAVIGDILSISVSTILAIASKGEGTPIILAFWVIIQRILVHQVRILIGYPYGDGSMTAGTCLANMEAVKLALAVKVPMFALKGFRSSSSNKMPPSGGKFNGSSAPENPKLGFPAILISEGNTEALKIAGIFTGIPASYLIKVKMDKNGRMDPKDLTEKILSAMEDGKMPFMVIASVGTTNFGATDPISEIVKITEKYDLWLHIDGSHGGPCLFSEEIKDKWAGVEKSNSFTFSFSSLMGVPYPSSFLITRNDGIFKGIWSAEKMFTMVASHIMPQLMQTPKVTDPGKVWLMWFIKGHRGLRQHVEYAYNMTKLLRKKMESRPIFKILTTEIDTPVVPFRVIPSNLKFKPEDGSKYIKELDKFTNDLKGKLIWQGFVYISAMRRRPGEPKHFMFPLSNAIMGESDMDYVLDVLECLAKNLEENKNAPCITDSMKTLMNSKTSKTTSSQDGFAPVAAALMPDLHLPLFKGIFEMIVKGGFGFGGKSGNDSILDLGLRELGMKQKDITPYFQDFMGFFMNMVPIQPFTQPFQAFKMMDKSVVITLMADFITSFMSPSMDSKEASPPFTRVKEGLETYIRTKVGYSSGEGDGVTVAPDGSMVTQYTISIAKYRKELKNKKDEEAPTDKTLVMFISTEAEYSWKMGAATLGLGADNCEYIPVDKKSGQMNLEALRKAIEASKTDDAEPFLVVGTLGTDVLGSLDHLNEIADICEEHKLWFHVDGRNGGPLILSDKQKNRLKGLDRSDSFSFSPRKFYPGESMTFAVLVTKEKGVFKKMNDKNQNSTEEKDSDDDSGSASGQRSSDEFKFFLLLKSEGASKTTERIETILKNTQTGIRLLKDRKQFQLILSAFELTSICFLYKPKGFKTGSDNDAEILDGIQIEVESILKKNKIYNVYYTNSSVYEGGEYGFLKIDIGLEITESEFSALISNIDKYGQDINVSTANKAKETRIAEEEEENKFTTTTTTTTVTTTTVTRTRRRLTKSSSSTTTETERDEEDETETKSDGKSQLNVKKPPKSSDTKASGGAGGGSAVGSTTGGNNSTKPSKPFWFG